MNGKSPKFLTTKQLPEHTGLSASFFEKGRVRGYGPPFIRIKSGSRSGKVLYRLADVERWLAAQECVPGGRANG